MQSTKNTQYSVLQEGALREETWEWADLVDMCRAGRMSPRSLIFMPEDKGWKAFIDTPLGEHFEARPADETEAPNASSAQLEAINDRYETVVSDLRETPNDVDLTLEAGELALAKGDTDAARGYYQRALEISPYHPRVAQEAKRNLPAARWRTLRFLERPPHVWEDPLSIFAYPFARGAVYFAVPVVVLALLSFTYWSLVPAVLVMYLWAIETVRSSRTGEKKPPLWHSLIKDYSGRILKPMSAALVNTAVLLLPFIGAAGVLILLGKGAGSDLVATIAKSPVITVAGITSVLLFLPAIFSIAASTRKRLIEMIDLRGIVEIIRVMELEYLAAVFFNVIFLCAILLGGRLFHGVPVLDRVLYSAATVYALLAGGFVLGKVYARFAERLDSPGAERESGPE